VSALMEAPMLVRLSTGEKRTVPLLKDATSVSASDGATLETAKANKAKSPAQVPAIFNKTG